MPYLGGAFKDCFHFAVPPDPGSIDTCSTQRGFLGKTKAPHFSSALKDHRTMGSMMSQSGKLNIDINFAK